MKRHGAALLSSILFMAGMGGVGVMVWVKLMPQPGSGSYVGSGRCEGCHGEISAAWAASRHTRMMQRLSPEVLIADLEDPAARDLFHRSDVAWVIGSKWEQQFMGEGAAGETLLPGAWMHLSSEWQLNGWDGWQVPVPKQRCHGCHTVGLDPDSGEFLEPNIGCESCHGPASWHVATWGFGRVTSTTSADACGQCHIRGKDPSGRTFFPVGFHPADRLEEHFTPIPPSPGQTSSQWWGNGHARDRHQEFTAWSQGGHSNSLRSLRDGYDGRFGPATDDCLPCHGAEAILQPWREESLESATEPITCSVCHNVHGTLDEPRVECADCHGGAGSAFYHTPERNPGHVPCPEPAEVACADCHMPKTAKIGGEYTLHSHSPGFVSPQEAERWGMPSGCQNGGCHAGELIDRLEAALAGRESHVPAEVELR